MLAASTLMTGGPGNGAAPSDRNGLAFAGLAATLSPELSVPNDESDSGGVKGATFEEMTFA